MEKAWARHAIRFVRTTFIGGLVFIAPVAVLIFLGTKAGGILRRLAKPLDALLPLDRLYGVLAADIVIIAAAIMVCFGAGLLARMSIANRFVKKAEAGVLWNVPGYGFIKALTESLEQNGSSMRPVLVRFDDYSQLAFEVERFPDGRRVIYVPSAPNPRAGSVLVLDPDRVEEVPLTLLAAVRSLRALGRGIGSALKAPRAS